MAIVEVLRERAIYLVKSILRFTRSVMMHSGRAEELWSLRVVGHGGGRSTHAMGTAI